MRRLLARLLGPRPATRPVASGAPPEAIRQILAAAVAHQQNGRPADAAAILATAVRSFPASPHLYSALGIAEVLQGKREEAQRAFEQALRIDGTNAEAHNNLGNVLLERGDFQRAEASYERALALRPDVEDFAINLAIAQERRGARDAARSTLETLLQHSPRSAAALNNLAALQIAGRDLAQAERRLRECLAIDPSVGEAWRNLADVLLSTGRPEEATACFDKALALRPNWPEVLAARARLSSATDNVGAEQMAQRAVTLAPRSPASYAALGAVRAARLDLDGAEQALREAVRLDPDSPHARYGLAMLLLLKGDYAEGFELYERRFEAFAASRPLLASFAQTLGSDRRWKGQSPKGRSMLLWTEQGYGDSIMMLRYVPLLKTLGATRVSVVCPEPLRRLVAAISGVDEVVEPDRDVSAIAYDLHCPLMSLPFAFRTERSSVPANVPYIAPDTAAMGEWAARLRGVDAPRVGLAWAGARTLEADARRSIPFALMTPLLERAAVRFFSVQKRETPSEGEAIDGRVVDWMSDCHDFADTASLLAHLDLVITVDTAVAHLAGAMAKPVWLLCRYGSEWRWGTTGTTTPWYPTMRIYRQAADGRWEPVIDAVQRDLDTFAGTSRAAAS